MDLSSERIEFDPQVVELESVDESIDKLEKLTESGDLNNALLGYSKIEEKFSQMNREHQFLVIKNKGNLLLKLGQLDRSEKYYKRAEFMKPKDSQIKINLGVLYLHREEVSKAKSFFVDVLEKDTAWDLAWIGMGLCHRQNGESDLALACVLRALDENSLNKIALTTYYQWTSEDGIVPSLDRIQNYLKKFPEDQEILDLLRNAKGI